MVNEKPTVEDLFVPIERLHILRTFTERFEYTLPELAQYLGLDPDIIQPHLRFFESLKILETKEENDQIIYKFRDEDPNVHLFKAFFDACYEYLERPELLRIPNVFFYDY